MKKILLTSAAVTIVFGLAACGNSGDDTAVVEEAVAVANDDGLVVIEAAKRPVFLGVEGGNVAVSGYDVTSYFTDDGTPVLGSEDFSVQYGEAVYHFASAANKEKFIGDPAAYVPKYGGHCAWAMSKGNLAPGNATLAKVVDGELFLNFNKEVQKDWLSDIPGYVEKSEAAWPTVPDDAVFGA